MFRFAIVSGCLGLQFVEFALLPTRFNMACLAVGCVIALCLLLYYFVVTPEQLLARSLKATEFEERDALLKKAAALATSESQRCRGAERAGYLLTLGKVRREQGLAREAQDAVECGLDLISELYGHGDLRIELTYLNALLSHELNYDAGAITLLERITAVPLHELTAQSRETQLKACNLLLDLLAKAGYEGSIPAVKRRLEVLRSLV